MHVYDYKKASDELKAYKEGDTTSEMDYQIWSLAHNQVEVAMIRLSALGIECAKKEKISIVNVIPYLWADAIASALFDNK